MILKWDEIEATRTIEIVNESDIIQDESFNYLLLKFLLK